MTCHNEEMTDSKYSYKIKVENVIAMRTGPSPAF